MSKHRTRGTRLSRLLSGVLCLALTLGLLPSVGLIQPAGAAHWADPYGEQLVEWGVMNPSKDLRLGSTVTRAEFVAMCNRAFGYTRLGSMPFVDVPSSAWYAQDINIAYNAGYFNGTSTDPSRPTASPNGTLTREQAAVLIARNLMLQETVGEVIAFTDSHDLSEWSRGLIGAAVAEGMIGGYEDGSYRPTQSITRGEVAKMLVSVIGTPINKAGGYELGSVYGNVMISSSDVELRNTVIAGNLYVTGGVDLGNVLLENVTVLGRIVVAGGGESHAGQSSVVLRNVAADELVIDSMIDQFTTVSAYGITDIPVTHVRSDAYLEDESWPGYGLRYIELDGDPGTLLQLAGTIKEVVNKTPFSTLQLAQGTAEKITIDEYARDSELILDVNTRVNELNLDVATLVHGNGDKKGDIGNLNIRAADCEVDMLPEHVDIRPGIVASVAGEPVDHTGAAELSSEPRLLAGYPKVANLTPTQAEAQFSGNKQGTIYYAVSELADGSVSEEHLVNNPAYGGIIHEDNAGAIAAASKTVYSRDLTKLEPDVSYYITAMLEDGRGNRSPIKVVSFTTPDNTVPEFLNGRISRETCDVVQLTGMPNKSCTLYWVLLPSGAAAPTAQNFKSGTFGGNYGRGSMSVTKNVPVSINVNGTTRLQEDTDYDLYVWLNDFNGAQSSQVYHFPVHTPDETPPVVIRIGQTNYTLADAIEFNFAINEEPSTLYWAVVTESDEVFVPENADLNSAAIQIKVENGTKAGAIVSGSKAADGAGVDTLVGSADFKNALKYETYHTHNFKLYYVAKDAYGNYSEVKYIVIHTKDAEEPTVKLDDTGTMDGKHSADNNLVLIFSEQVKGSDKMEADTFVDLYNEVLANEDVGGNALTAAKNALAKELAAHIELFYKPKSVMEGDDVPLPVVDKTPDSTPEFNGGGAYPYGWVNWHEATVTLQRNGTVILTLPAGKAVSLGSGMDYYFRFTNIYDDSYDHNLLMTVDQDDKVIDDGKTGVCELPFSTVYATVWLELNRTDGAPKPPELGGEVIIDRILDVSPKNTGNMSDECWDMVIWNRTAGTAIGITIYRREKASANATWGAWEQVTEEFTILGGNLPAASVNAHKIVTGDGRYETVKAGLAQDHYYQYGINFNRVGSSRNRDTWTGVIELEASLVAGSKGVIEELAAANDVNSGYNARVHPAAGSPVLSEISLTPTERKPILEFTKEFSDSLPPSFGDAYPSFPEDKITSSSITMQVGLDRAGYAHYVVAPADGSILITYQITENGRLKTVTIGEDNDGRQLKTGEEPTGLSYIPTGGADRNNHADNILFVSGGNEDPEKTNTKEYSFPSSEDVFTQAFDNSNGDLRMDSVSYKNRVVDETFTGLTPDTWYYVLIVLQSESNQGVGGTPDTVVQVYRVKTKEAQPPTIAASRNGAVVNMEVYEGGTNNTTLHENPALYYVTVREDELASWMTEAEYTWNNALKNYDGNPEDMEDEDKDTTDAGAGSMTVFKALTTRASNGKTVFDTYANKYLREKVMYYITDGTDNGTKDDSIRTHQPIYTSTAAPDCSGDMSEDGEYYVLMCAKHREKGKAEWDAYGFYAITGLYRPNPTPPEFSNVNGIDGVSRHILRGTFTGVFDPTKAVNGGNNISSFDWKSHSRMQDYVFSGNLTLRFEDKIYVYSNGFKQVVNKPRDSDVEALKLAPNEISILDVIGAQGFDITEGASVGDGTAFNLTYTKIESGTTITMQNLYNSGGVVKSNKKLTITFSTSITQAQLNVDEGYDPGYLDGDNTTMYVPSFRVTWQ